jgi:hypothetical protein
MTANSSPEPQSNADESLATLKEILAVARALHTAIMPLAGKADPAERTAASVRMVAVQMLAGHGVMGIDDFWVQCAHREIDRVASECEEAIASAVKALIRKRFHPAQARILAITVLLASHHPALRHPLLALVEWSEARTDDDPDEGGDVAQTA